MGVPCRCNRKTCRARKTLSKHPNLYVREPICKACGIGLLKADTYRIARKDKLAPSQRTCRCDAALYPHGRGSLTDCIQREDYVIEQMFNDKNTNGIDTEEVPF